MLIEVDFFASGSSLGIFLFLHLQYLGTSAFGGNSQEVLRSSFNFTTLFQSQGPQPFVTFFCSSSRTGGVKQAAKTRNAQHSLPVLLADWYSLQLHLTFAPALLFLCFPPFFFGAESSDLILQVKKDERD